MLEQFHAVCPTVEALAADSCKCLPLVVVCQVARKSSAELGYLFESSHHRDFSCAVGK